jgi:TRAP transporter 4TM/12TM fusion protein
MNLAGKETSLKTRVIGGILILGALYHLVYVSGLLLRLDWYLLETIHRAISLTFGIALVYSLIPPSTGKRNTWLTVYNFVMMSAGLASTLYVVFFYDNIVNYAMQGRLDMLGEVMVLLLVISLLEAVRRTAGKILMFIILAAFLGTMFNNLLPGALHGSGYDVSRLGMALYVQTYGIFGAPLAVAARIIVTFSLFVAMLELSGAGQWFIDLAKALVGGMSGGPAKVAVVGSGFLGSIVGSPSTNVATTGSLTIPMMKRLGYKPSFAAAVEAVASTGGQLLPPVMGAIAFLMAEFLAMPYIEVARAAIFPALLFYFVIILSVHLEAKKIGLKGIPRNELPSFIETFKTGWFYLTPIITLVFLMIFLHYKPEHAGFYSIGVLILVSMLNKKRELRLYPRKIILGLTQGMRSWTRIVTICAAIGIIIGCLTQSGLGVKLSFIILDVSQGRLWMVLGLTAVASFILGMGLDSISAYIMLTILIAPALIKIGVLPIAAHLFVMFWGMASFWTPPVAICTFIASSIADSNFWETGLRASLLGIVAFIIPFLFVYEPALLLQGSLSELAVVVVTAIMGAAGLAFAIQGYLIGKLNWWQRILFGACGIILLQTFVLPLQLGAFAALVVMIVWHWRTVKKEAK